MVTHWVTISNFNEQLSYPNELDLSRREHTMLAIRGADKTDDCHRAKIKEPLYGYSI